MKEAAYERMNTQRLLFKLRHNFACFLQRRGRWKAEGIRLSDCLRYRCFINELPFRLSLPPPVALYVAMCNMQAASEDTSLSPRNPHSCTDVCVCHPYQKPPNPQPAKPSARQTLSPPNPQPAIYGHIRVFRQPSSPVYCGR